MSEKLHTRMQSLILTLASLFLILCSCGNTSTPINNVPKSSAVEFQFIRGFDTWMEGDVSAQQVTNWIKTVQALNVNYINITFPIYTTGWQANTVFIKQGSTPSDASLSLIIQQAHDANLKVLLRPTLDETNLKSTGHWRGSIMPTKPADWFTQYGAVMQHYAILCKLENCDALAIGAELHSLEASEYSVYMNTIVTKVQADYSGQLTYCFNSFVKSDEFSRWSPWVQKLSFLSVDAYWNMPGVTDKSSLSQVVDALKPGIQQTLNLKKHFGKPIVLTELGMRSQNNALADPSAWYTNEPINLQVQDTYFRAIFQPDVTKLFNGIFVWGNKINTPLADPENASFDIFGKPAQDTIAAAYNAIATYDNMS